ncbi:MAG: MerR family transcriptional regulator [Cellulosilyticaceae bacterium]
MKINDVAKMAGTTVRTLHYYDEIGLLQPSKVTEAGYRIYEATDLERLQQILFFRELDFSLGQIKEIMTNPQYDKEEALAKHRELLIKKRKRLEGLIELVDRQLEGEKDMNFEAFDMTEIEKAKKQYADEVKERWGSTDAYKESKEKTKHYDKKKWGEVTVEGDVILQAFGEHRGYAPESDEVQELVRKWQDHISNSFYQCTKEILSGLGLMYVADERFTKNIDQHGEGTAKLMSEAIAIYCKE